jgi:hypothetical protein
MYFRKKCIDMIWVNQQYGNKNWFSDLEEMMIFAVEFANIWTWSHYGDIE